MPKRFFYGQTIREAYLRARRKLKPSMVKKAVKRERGKRKKKPSGGDRATD